MADSVQKIPVFFHSSDEYSPFIAVTMASILYNTNSFIEFYVIETGISDFHKRQIEKLSDNFSNFSIEWIRFEYNDIFKKEYFDSIRKENLHNPAWPGIHAFCTPFIPLLKPNLDKVIYLDLDVILLDDIKLLYDENLENKALGVVPDIVCPLFVGEEQKSLNPKIKYGEFGRYFCAGVLLINSKKFREENIIERYFEIAGTEIVPVCDQDILNRLCSENDCVFLDQKYDVIYQPKKEELQAKGIDVLASVFTQAKENVVIRHFADVKPWTVSYMNWAKKTFFHCGDFWFFAKMTPFYEGIFNEYMQALQEDAVSKLVNKFSEVLEKSSASKPSETSIIRYSFLGVPFFKVKKKNAVKKYYLFGVFHLFSIEE